LDNPVYLFLDRISDLVVLNVLWLLFCIPVITAGAATKAMWAVHMAIAAKTEPSVSTLFVSEFRHRFKKSTLTFLLIGGAAAILAIDFMYAPIFGNTAGDVIRIAVIAFSVIVLWIGIYVYPVQMIFEISIRESIKKAFLISLLNLPGTIVMGLIFILPALILFWKLSLTVYLIPIYILIGFSLLFFGAASVMNKVIDKYRTTDTPQ
jgi:uncharacterized membrane protein YesL